MAKTLWHRDAGRCLGYSCLFASLVAAAGLLTASAQAAEKPAQKEATLEEELLRQAPKIRDFLWHKMKHPEKQIRVGVVKFLVQVGEQRPSDNAGPLNWHLARRLEAALILTLDSKTEADTFRILHIHDPKKELMTSANHRTEDGRKAFFQDKKYRPAWESALDKEEAIPADVFLTGVVKITDEARTLQITVQAFDRTGREPVNVCNFSVAAEPRLLAEAGVSFGLSRGSNAEDVAKLVANWKKPELPPEATPIVRTKQTLGVKPKQGATVRQLLERSPIDIQILYKDKGAKKAKEVDIDDDGTVPEPTEGTKVSFRLKHKNNQDKYTYGVILKVNGENTIYPEEAEPDDVRAHKWILSPKDDFLITGYLKKGLKDQAATFTGLPVSESKLEEVNYGPHAGAFTLVIFLGRPDSKDRAEVEQSEVARATSRGVPEELGNPNSLTALQRKLRGAAARNRQPMTGRPRGLIVPGEPMKQEVDTVEFHAYHTPVSVIQLRYYKPRNQE
jgi:hypothetical protein